MYIMWCNIINIHVLVVINNSYYHFYQYGIRIHAMHMSYVIQYVNNFNHDHVPIKILIVLCYFFYLLVCVFICCKQHLCYDWVRAVVCVTKEISEKFGGLKNMLPLLSDHIINHREDPSFLRSILTASRNAPPKLKN